MNKITAILLLAFLTLSAPWAQADEATILSKAELVKLFPGKFYAVVNSAVGLKISARRNGVLLGQMAGKSDEGRWSVKGDRLCVVWSSWLDGKASCSKVREVDGWYHGVGVKFRKI